MYLRERIVSNTMIASNENRKTIIQGFVKEPSKLRHACMNRIVPTTKRNIFIGSPRHRYRSSVFWIIDFYANVKEHATPLAGAGVETGVEVHVTGDVADSSASGGCCVSSCSASFL